MPASRRHAGTPPLKLIPVRSIDWPGWVCSAILAVAGFVAYSRTFSVPLLYDDIPAILNNPTIRHWDTVLSAPGQTTAYGRPILNLSLALNQAISGTAVWSYHVLNLVIHILAGLTLFGIVRRTLARRGDAAAQLIGFSVALLWTLHPLQTEAVTYIVQRAESLMGLFYLLTLYCFIRGIGAERADASGPHAGRASRVWFVLCVATCLLGMATKEVMVSAPLMVLLYDRTFAARSFREAWRRHRGLHLALAATWLLLVGLVAGSGWDRNGASGFDVGITPWAYWLTQFQAVTRYLCLSVWPHPLVFEYGTFWVNHPTDVALSALVVVMLLAAVLVALWRQPVPGFLGAWFFAILAPTSVMPGRFQMIVEHRMYLPLAAVVVGAVAGLQALRRRLQDRGPVVRGPVVSSPVVSNFVVGSPLVPVVLLLALALGFGLLTALRNEDYRSELGIWNDTVAKRPGNERARLNLGLTLSKTPGRLNDAVAQYEAALRLKPDFAEVHNNLGVALAQIPGRLNDAVAEFQAALRLKPDYAEAHNNLGLAQSSRLESLDVAIVEFETALRLKPDYPEAHDNLGLALAQMPGRLKAAIAEFEEALRLMPDYVKAHNNLGLALAQMPGRMTDAIVQFQQVLRLQPDYASGWHNLGLGWFRLGNMPAAAAAFREELRLSPNDPAAQQALAAALGQTDGH